MPPARRRNSCCRIKGLLLSVFFCPFYVVTPSGEFGLKWIGWLATLLMGTAVLAMVATSV
jgi:hypothetical protein